jgi:hypothetical protein
MSETPPEDPQKPTLMERGKKAMETADRAGSIAESASSAFGAVKWVAIAIVTLTLAGGVYGVYKVVSAPAKAVGNAAGAVTESVKSGTDKIKQSGAEVINRLDITTTNQTALNRAAEAAFKSLNTMTASEPESMKDRIYRRTHFGGHENQVCLLEVKTGTVSIPVTLAADNEAHATAKALGAKDNRLIRMILTAGEEELALRTEWDEDSQNWVMRWKATTIKKEIGDDVAEDRIMDVLGAAAKGCK